MELEGIHISAPGLEAPIDTTETVATTEANPNLAQHYAETPSGAEHQGVLTALWLGMPSLILVGVHVSATMRRRP